MRSARFERAYAAHYEPIFAYALRRTDSVQDASDVVADVFLTAWRRVEDMPDGEETILWLYGIARRTLANHARSRRRYDRLGSSRRGPPRRRPRRLTLMVPSPPPLTACAPRIKTFSVSSRWKGSRPPRSPACWVARRCMCG
ncbi:RNA polymerase sigma factor [Dactylosporangium maewongense]|uniref:RNA polymerase sigma factor n=1 Tax=Dactylosporangium maewongense TaxID=634393 RepID=UPI0031E26F3A